MRYNGIAKILYTALFASLIAVCAFISIPFPIPLTMQLFAVFLSLMTLGGAYGSLSIIIYLCLGLLGLPVFASFGSGIGYLLGASGGFVIAFPIAALLFFVLEKALSKKESAKILYAFLSLAIIYAIGALWFSLVYADAADFGEALLVCVLPYFLPDAIKILLAYKISKRLKKINKFS